MNRKKLFFRLALLVIFIFILNSLALKFHLYFTIWWFDMLMHFLGGFWLALASIWILSLAGRDFKSIFEIIGLVLLVGILWEVFEFITINKYLVQNPFNLMDTLSDICFDLAGGFAGIFYYAKRIILNSENKIHPVVEL